MGRKLCVAAFVVDTDNFPEAEKSDIATYLEVKSGGHLSGVVVWDSVDDLLSDHRELGPVDVAYLVADGDKVSASIEVFPGWSVADADAAFAEGWNINECGDGQLVIFADEDSETNLADHLIAHALVERRAAAGSELHQRALALVNGEDRADGA